MQWLAGLSLVGLAIAIFASMLVASLLGYAVRRLERRLVTRAEQPEHSQESYLVGGMIGLMALLLARVAAEPKLVQG